MGYGLRWHGEAARHPSLRAQDPEVIPYKESFASKENRTAYEVAERLVQYSPIQIDENANWTEVEIPCEKGKLPADFEPIRRDYYGAPAGGRLHTMGIKRLSGDKSYEMVEDLASIILYDPGQSPLSPEQLYVFDEMVTEANHKNINPWAYAIEEMPKIAGALGQAWEKSRDELYSAALERYERMANPPATPPCLQAWPS